MALSHSPRIITDGLVLCLDAGNTKSYDITTPVQAVIWTDLSGQGNNGTLVNGVGYDSGNLGSLVFDGINDLCTINEIGSLSNFTIESWFKPTSYPNNNSCVIASVYGGPNARVNFKIGYEGTSLMYGGFYDTTWRLTPGINTSLNTWQQVIFTYDGNNLTIYTNGNSGGSTIYSGSPTSSGLGLRIGRRWDIEDYFAGNIGTTKIYNRALTDFEVQQNFNALRGRYGI